MTNSDTEIWPDDVFKVLINYHARQVAYVPVVVGWVEE